MKSLTGKHILLFLIFSTAYLHAQSARDYYSELRKADGLDHMANGHVCFDDDVELKTFFIFGESWILRDFLKSNGQYGKMTKAQQRTIDRDWLIVRSYDKGVPSGNEDFYDKDSETTWVTPFTLNKKKYRMALSIAPATLRYKRTVEVLSANGIYQVQASRYGRCFRGGDENTK